MPLDKPSMPTYGDYDGWRSQQIYAAYVEMLQVNGMAVSREEYERARMVTASHRCCPYCGVRLRVMVLGGGWTDSPRSHYERRLGVCDGCGFWCGQYSCSLDEGIASRYSVSKSGAAILRRMPLDVPDVPIRELVGYLQRNPTALRQLHPKAFERLVGDCFRANWGAAEVKYVGGPDDGGVDVVLVMSEKERWLIQCKRRATEDAVEAVSTVRELLGTLLTEGELRGIVVSTADHFSYHARRLAGDAHLSDLGYDIRLADYGILREMLVCQPREDFSNSQSAMSKKAPWYRFFATDG